jgi:hypothetical protein
MQLRDAVRAHLREQALWCEALGSRFTARLIERMGADFDAGGPVAGLLGDWPGHPRADAVAVRLCGALHAAALTGRDSALRAEYPEQRPEWDGDAVWSAAWAFIAREQAWVARSTPESKPSRVLLPLPLGPHRNMRSPGATVKSSIVNVVSDPGQRNCSSRHDTSGTSV